MIKDLVKRNGEFTLTKIAEMIGISRQTLNIALNEYRDKGKCVNPKCMILFTEIIDEKVSNALFLVNKINRINKLFDDIEKLKESVDDIKKGINPENREIISNTLGMLNSLLIGDYDAKIIDDALKVIAKVGNRAFSPGGKEVDEVIGYQTIVNKNSLNVLDNMIKKRDREIEERNIMGQYATVYDGRYFKYNKSKYKVGELITGTIEEIKETECIIGFEGSLGIINKKHILKSNYEGNLKISALVEVRISKIDKEKIHFSNIHFLE